MPKCCACGREGGAAVETHRDETAAVTYTLYRCGGCELVYSEPRDVRPDWYAQAVPLEPVLEPARDWRFDEFFKDVPPGRILDVGCGDGGFLRLARSRGYDASGFDWDARKAAPGVRTEDWEGFCRSQPEGAFDAVTLFDVLEHVPEPAALAGELRRLLKPGGKLVITLPNEARPLPFGRESYDYPPHHFTRWTAAALKGLLESAGFRVARQDASMRELFYFHDVMLVQCALRPAARLKRRLRPAPAAGNGDGCRPAAAPRPLFRLFRAAAQAALWPAAAVLVTYYKVSRTDPGHCLYTVAEKHG